MGLLVKEKQCENIGLQDGMTVYIPQETSEEEFFSELFERYGSDRKCHRKKC